MARIAVLGVGNPARGDDAAGPLCAAGLKERLSGGPDDRILVLDGGEVPESQTGALRRFGPDLTIIVDAVLGGRPAGTVFIVDPAKIADEEVSTHRISLLYLVRYLEESIGSRVLILGIEPDSVEWGAGTSDAVRAAVEEVAAGLARLLNP